MKKLSPVDQNPPDDGEFTLPLWIDYKKRQNGFDWGAVERLRKLDRNNGWCCVTVLSAETIT